jgi:hypothetical protein
MEGRRSAEVHHSSPSLHPPPVKALPPIPRILLPVPDTILLTQVRMLVQTQHSNRNRIDRLCRPCSPKLPRGRCLIQRRASWRCVGGGVGLGFRGGGGVADAGVGGFSKEGEGFSTALLTVSHEKGARSECRDDIDIGDVVA